MAVSGTLEVEVREVMVPAVYSDLGAAGNAYDTCAFLRRLFCSSSKTSLQTRQ